MSLGRCVEVCSDECRVGVWLGIEVAMLDIGSFRLEVHQIILSKTSYVSQSSDTKQTL